MAEQPDRVAFQGRWVLPVASAPISDGVVTVEHRQIVHVGSAARHGRPQQLGNVALMPALVNAHAHLDLTAVERPLGGPPVAFDRWLAQVVQWRREQAAGGGDSSRQSVAAGLELARQAGTGALGDIAPGSWQAGSWAEHDINCTVFLELIGLRADRTPMLLDAARRHLASPPSATDQVRPGLSPHAPYTVHPQLVRGLCTMSAEHCVPVAMHVAESRQELQLLQSGTGPLQQLLAELHAWDAAAIPPGSRPLDYLRALARAHRALVIHGNYLAEDEIGLLAHHSDHMSLVYCPRTHAFFGHDPYPLARLLAAGVRVALGTDSLASNPDLSLLGEMRFVAQRHEDVSPAAIIRMGTLAGAEALGVADRLGSLSAGKRAALIAVPLPDEAGDPCELLLHSTGQPYWVYPKVAKKETVATKEDVRATGSRPRG